MEIAACNLHRVNDDQAQNNIKQLHSYINKKLELLKNSACARIDEVKKSIATHLSDFVQKNEFISNNESEFLRVEFKIDEIISDIDT